MKTKTLVAMASVLLVFCSLNAAWTNAQPERHRFAWRANTLVESGTPVTVRLDTKISTENAKNGDPWTGTVTEAVGGIPAGSTVTGVVTDVAQGTHETPARLALAVRNVTVDGQQRSMRADTEPIIAGSHRAKKIGAIAGGAVVGGLVGHAVGGKVGTIIGGVAGGYGAERLTRHAMRTMQLKEGTVLTFTTREDVLARR
jgi:uncharacterized protein YcfJ